MSAVTTPVPNQVLNQGPASFSGRKAERCDCISSKTFYTVVLVVGLIFLFIGALALAGHYAPLSNTGVSSPLFARFHEAFNFVANQLGTSPLLIISFATAFGLVFTCAGGVGLFKEGS